jgi:hypothetical protein
VTLCIFIIPPDFCRVGNLASCQIQRATVSQKGRCEIRASVRAETRKCVNKHLWDVTPCRSGRSLSAFRRKVPPPSSAPFYPECGVTRFLRNVGSYQYKASYPQPFYPENGGTGLLRTIGNDLSECEASYSLPFYPEGGDISFLRNVGNSPPDYTASHSSRQ